MQLVLIARRRKFGKQKQVTPEKTEAETAMLQLSSKRCQGLSAKPGTETKMAPLGAFRESIAPLAG